MQPELIIFLQGVLLGATLLGTAYWTYLNIRAYKIINAEINKTRKAVDLYEAAVKQLPESDRKEIYRKASNTVEMIDEAQALPEKYYEDLDTTKAAHVKQLALEHKKWLERNNYPVFEKYLEK